MTEITIARTDVHKGYLSIDFTIGDRNEVGVTKRRDMFSEGHAYSPATLNWWALGAQPVAVAQAYAALIQHAAAYASMLDTLTDEQLDAMVDSAEVEEARRMGYERTAAGEWVKIEQS